jgi:hypothetical protein
MLIEHATALEIAERHLDIGLELAFRADEAYDARRQANALVAAISLYDDCPDDEEPDVAAYFERSNAAQVEAAAHAADFSSLVTAAAAFIGPATLGGELLRIQNDMAPILQNDGSHPVGAR